MPRYMTMCERCRTATELFYCRSVDEFLCERCIHDLAADHYDEEANEQSDA